MVSNVTTKLAELNLEDRFLFDETMENKEALRKNGSEVYAIVGRKSAY